MSNKNQDRLFYCLLVYIFLVIINYQYENNLILVKKGYWGIRVLGYWGEILLIVNWIIVLFSLRQRYLIYLVVDKYFWLFLASVWLLHLYLFVLIVSLNDDSHRDFVGLIR